MNRDFGKNVLKEAGITKPQNINIIEKEIFNYNKIDEAIYIKVLYEIVNDFKNGVKLSDILKKIKNRELEFNNKETFEELINEEKEQDEFIERPFHVEEGIVECHNIINGKKCGSKRVFTFSKQMRGGDEGITSFHECLACRKKWNLNT